VSVASEPVELPVNDSMERIGSREVASMVAALPTDRSAGNPPRCAKPWKFAEALGSATGAGPLSGAVKRVGVRRI
jgi:hypothetical protein